MKFSKIAATSALVIAAMSITYGTANAAPAAQAPDNSTVSTQVLPGIHYKASVVDHSVVLTTDAGSLTTRGNQFQVLDASGKLVAGVPLTYNMDGKSWPIAAKIQGNTATLTPGGPVRAAGLPLHQVDATANPNFNQALSNLNSELTLGVATGTLIGTIVGAGGGCLLGGAIPAFTIVALPAAVGTCIGGAVIGAPIGALAGTILIGGPVAVASGIQFMNDINTPPAPVKAGA
ncbi:hypothetical protein G4X40_08495 [Rhodococcus sp. D2-41]|uniref:hypothetical protein n=1 Tax=Speluncibacter jeojiensis TaxID=2710754 RepID=UPI00240FBF9C|nr:hypothetical protein [Rhodococcus sp. D2-41]MDG3010190.1 hypothetical protein [Rhodococcus sp. D2-41]